MKRRLFAKLSVNSAEDGFAAIVIALVLVLVLSLITVGFAELMRHEESSALDKQLSSQAYYAAESGINDAIRAINSGYKDSKSSCGTIGTVPDLKDNAVKFTGGNNPTSASYPCLLINPAPPSLHYDPIATTISRTAEFTAIDSNDQPSSVDHIRISWQDSGDNKSFAPNCNAFKTSDPAINPNTWQFIGMLRVQLLPLNGDLSTTNLTNSALTAFLCPNGQSSPGNNTIDYINSLTPDTNGPIAYGNCVDPTPANQLANCSVTIDRIPANQPTFFINMRSIYAPTSVTITAYNTGDTQLRLKGAQTLVDSTGKAQDVLRRVQVRIPTTKGYDIPDGTHADICKQFDLDPANTSPSPDSATNGGCGATSLTQ